MSQAKILQWETKAVNMKIYCLEFIDAVTLNTGLVFKAMLAYANWEVCYLIGKLPPDRH